MYGMIHQAVRDLAISQSGREGWDQFAAENGLSNRNFIGVDYYSDAETMALVHLISRHGGKSFDEALFAVGYHLISFIGSSAYARILNMAGKDMNRFLDDLDLMHMSVKAHMPLASLPSFQVEHPDDQTIELLYLSKRQGLSSMVRGLLSGVADRFGEVVEIEQAPHPRGIMFTIRRVKPHA